MPPEKVRHRGDSKEKNNQAMFALSKIGRTCRFINRAKLSLSSPVCTPRFFTVTNVTLKEEQAGSGDKVNDADAKNTNEDAQEIPDLAGKESDEIAILTAEVKELKEKVIRCYAEEENVRRIAKRDVENARTYSNVKFAKSLLEVADNLDLALAAVENVDYSKASPSESEATLKTLIEGVNMTNTGLLKVFSANGIKKFGSAGDKFDPELHDALFQIPDPTKEENTIGQIIKSGFTYKDRVIRAASVGTIHHP